MQIKACAMRAMQSRNMTQDTKQTLHVRPISVSDFRACVWQGWDDFKSAPLSDLFFANVFVLAGLIMSTITFATGTTFWLVLAVLGFPLIGSLAALGFYEISRRRAAGVETPFKDILSLVWGHRTGQLPWLATIIVVIFLFWFFLGHMIFALFLGLAPMTNISSSLNVFLTSDGVTMLLFGTAVGAVFAVVVFSISVIGMPLLFDRDVDFVTAMITSGRAVRQQPILYLGWGICVGVVTMIAMLPAFLGLFIAMPVLGHATWHIYRRAVVDDPGTPAD